MGTEGRRAAWNPWQKVGLGQLLSLCLVGTGASSAWLASHGTSLPTFQAALSYGLLVLVYGHTVVRKRCLANAWWKYALLALMDLEANTLIVLAYRYTSITSVTLLDCWAIPAAIFLSWALRRASYVPRHFLGAAVSVLGFCLLALSDATEGDSHTFGNALVLAAATTYAAANVLEEMLLTDGKPATSELLGMVGFFGLTFAAAQSFVVDRAALDSLSWASLPPLACFALSMLSFYSLAPLMLVEAGAAAMNLSLLSSDVWAALVRITLPGGFSRGAAAAFATALAFVGAGQAIYATAGDPRPALPAGRGAQGQRHDAEEGPASFAREDGNESQALVAQPSGTSSSPEHP
ncbi:unnamed protein product [Pedinophyceae sp. YPF-701]|nr:unnamed protein product [Pedinophyceae sp. YPF-701]